jgi:anti-sigma regulatory factor (Ser/Thr protein kinase)
MTVGTTDHEQQAFAAVPASARSARLFVVDALRRRGADPTVIGDYQLVVSELAANIIEHGDGSDMVVIIADAGSQWWEVEVVDGPSFGLGQGLRPDSWAVADAGQFSGRGLGIVRKLMDDIVIAVADGHVSVRCRRRRQHQ